MRAELVKGNLADLAGQINAKHLAVQQALTAGLAHAVDAGKLLIQVKAMLDHGQWLPWLKGNCPAISERTAQAYMRVAREYPSLAEANPQRVADLSFRQAIKFLAEPGKAKAGWDRFIPPPGHLLIGTVGSDEVWIVPSKHDGYYYVTHVHFKGDNSGTEAQGLKRPIRADGIALLMDAVFPEFGPSCARWKAAPSPDPPLSYNPWLYDSEEQYVKVAVLGNRRRWGNG